MAGVAASILWIALAVSHPTVTYHFAPAVLAAAPALAAADRRSSRTGVVVAGLLFAHLTTAGLWAADALRGPTFFGSDGAGLEALVMAWLGGLVAGAIAGRRLPAVDPDPATVPAVPAPVGAEGDQQADQSDGDGGDHRPLEA